MPFIEESDLLELHKDVDKAQIINERLLDQIKFKNKELKTLSNKLLFSNSSEGVLINKDYTKGLQLRGYTTNGFEKLDIVKNQNFYGNGKLISKHISIGKELSINFNINIGDKVLIMSPSGVQTIVGNLPKQETYIVDSIFDSGLADFDQNIAFINIKDLEERNFELN